jgi:hypothetical protein
VREPRGSLEQTGVSERRSGEKRRVKRNSAAAPETETEKISLGGRILKYDRRVALSKNSIGAASPNYSSSSHSVAYDWLRDDAFYRLPGSIGCGLPPQWILRTRFPFVGNA